MMGSFLKNNNTSNQLSKSLKNGSLYGLLNTLYKDYPNYVAFEKLNNYQNILKDFSNNIISSKQENSKIVSEAVSVQLTNYIEKQDNLESYRITIKGIELLNAMDLKMSSERLEKLSNTLLALTVLLAIFTLTDALSYLYINYKIQLSEQILSEALNNFITFLVISAIIIVLSFFIAQIIIKHLHYNKREIK